jgi:hypothetical protein
MISSVPLEPSISSGARDNHRSETTVFDLGHFSASTKVSDAHTQAVTAERVPGQLRYTTQSHGQHLRLWLRRVPRPCC